MPGSDLRKNVMRKRYTLNPGVDIAGVYFDGHKDIDLPGVNIEGPLEGTLQNPEQPNITTVGTLTNLVVESKETITGRDTNDILPPPLPPPALTVNGNLQLNGELLTKPGASIGTKDNPVANIFIKNETMTFVNDDETTIDLTGDSLTPNSIPGHEFTFKTNLAVKGGKTFRCDKLFASKIDATGNICTNKKFIGDLTGNVTGNLDGIVGENNPAAVTGTIITANDKFIGDVSANDISGVNLDLAGDFNVTGNSTVNLLNAGASTLASATITGDAAVQGNAALTGTLNVTGDSVFTGDISANDISGANLDLTGDFNVTGTSVFTGDISANDISGANLDLTGDFNVTGASVFTGDISANDISGANLDLTGSLNANNIVAVGDISGATFRGNDAFSTADLKVPDTHAPGGSNQDFNVSDTYNGYTIFQVVNCLKEFGFLQ